MRRVPGKGLSGWAHHRGDADREGPHLRQAERASESDAATDDSAAMSVDNQRLGQSGRRIGIQEE